MNEEIKFSPDHVLGKCYLCKKTITYGTNRAIGVEGHGDAAKLYHEDCMQMKEHRESTYERRRLVRMLALTGAVCRHVKP